MKLFKLCVLAFTISLISLCYAQDSIVYKTESEMNHMQGENFLPLAKGNVFQIYYWYLNGNDQHVIDQYLCKIAVLDTIKVNNDIYYKISHTRKGQYYLRYDKASNKVYKTYSLSPVNEYLLFDFNLQDGTPYLQGDTLVTAVNSGFLRGYCNGVENGLTVSKNVGFYSFYEHHPVGPTQAAFMDAFIKDSNITYYVINNGFMEPPFYSINMPASISLNSWHIRFEYRVPTLLRYWVDSLIMHAYYKKGSDSILCENIYLHHNLGVVDTTLSLDSSLFRQNYKFYYRIEYKDKFLMAHHFYYPQTGYACLSSLMDVKNENLQEMKYSLGQNYPNPFNPTTTINYYIPSESKVNITVYNALGSKVKELISENKPQGNYEVKFDGTGLASGVYFVTLKAASVDGKQSLIDSKKMILMK